MCVCVCVYKFQINYKKVLCALNAERYACFDVDVFFFFVSLYLYVPDEGSLLPKYRDCTTSNDFESYLMCCGVMLQ